MEEKKENDIRTDLAVIRNDVEYLKQELHEVKSMLQSEYVTKTEYEPVKKIVFGLVGIILVAVVGAIVALVIK